MMGNSQKCLQEKMVRKLKVCFVSLNIYNVLTKNKSTKAIGGAEVQLLKIADELIRRDVDLSFITLDHNPGELVSHPYKLIKSFNRETGLRGIRFIYPRTYKIWQALKQSDADIFYLNAASYILGIVMLYAKMHNKKVVFCGAIDTDFVPAKLPVPTEKDRRLYMWGIRNCHKIIVQNTTQLETLQENFNLRGELIHYGAPRQMMSEQQVVLWVASIKEKKHPELFIELARQNPDQKFVMIGGKVPTTDKNYNRFYEDILEQTRNVPNLDYKGLLPFEEAEKWFARAKVFMNTSDLEGFPMTYLQAWSRGVPVVTFIDPDGLIKTHQLGAVAKDIDEMSSILKRFFQGEVTFSNDAIKNYFDENLTIERAVDKITDIFYSLTG